MFTARSNIFKVKDQEAFKEKLKTICSYNEFCFEDDNAVVLGVRNEYGPCLFGVDINDKDIVPEDYYSIIVKHLAEGSTCVITEVVPQSRIRTSVNVTVITERGWKTLDAIRTTVEKK